MGMAFLEKHTSICTVTVGTKRFENILIVFSTHYTKASTCIIMIKAKFMS